MIISKLPGKKINKCFGWSKNRKNKTYISKKECCVSECEGRMYF